MQDESNLQAVEEVKPCLSRAHPRSIRLCPYVATAWGSDALRRWRIRCWRRRRRPRSLLANPTMIHEGRTLRPCLKTPPSLPFPWRQVSFARPLGRKRSVAAPGAAGKQAVSSKVPRHQSWRRCLLSGCGRWSNEPLRTVPPA